MALKDVLAALWGVFSDKVEETVKKGIKGAFEPYATDVTLLGRQLAELDETVGAAWIAFAAAHPDAVVKGVRFFETKALGWAEKINPND